MKSMLDVLSFCKEMSP